MATFQEAAHYKKPEQPSPAAAQVNSATELPRTSQQDRVHTGRETDCPR